MGLEQQVWSLSDGKRLREVKAPSEKQIEDLLAANIEILDAGWLVIGRQVKTEGGGFIDILCIDQQGALVVVELKRELTPREVTAQALDYASCVSVFTEAQIAETYMAYSRKLGRPETLDKAYERKFGMKLDDDAFRGDAGRNEVKIVVVATRMDGSTECASLMLSVILGRDDLTVESASAQKWLQSVEEHSAKLDVLAHDREGNSYDIEMQKDEKGAGRKRARYYSAMMDADALGKGKEYDELPESFVIFITPGDAIGKGQALYEIERTVKNSPLI